MLAIIVITVVSPLLNIRGRFLCLAYSPAIGGAKKMVTAVAFTEVIILLLALTNILISLPENLDQLGLFEALLSSFLQGFKGSICLIVTQMINTTLFIFYLRWLSLYFDCKKYADRAMIILALGVAAIVLLIFAILILFLGIIEQSSLRAGTAAVLLFIVTWALYGDLHYHIRGVILRNLWKYNMVQWSEMIP